MPLSLTNLINRLKPVAETALVGVVMVVSNAVLIYFTGTKDPTVIGAFNIAEGAALNWLTSHARDLYTKVLEAVVQPQIPPAPAPVPVLPETPANLESGAK